MSKEFSMNKFRKLLILLISDSPVSQALRAGRRWGG